MFWLPLPLETLMNILAVIILLAAMMMNFLLYRDLKKQMAGGGAYFTTMAKPYVLVSVILFLTAILLVLCMAVGMLPAYWLLIAAFLDFGASVFTTYRWRTR